MEAIAQWDFRANNNDEMSFKKGTRIYILNFEEQDWYKAICGTQSGFIPATYVQLKGPSNWFVGKIPRLDAEYCLLTKDRMGNFVYPDGAFLVRNSESNPDGFSLSVKHENNIQHFKILTNSMNKFYIWPDTEFTSVNDLVLAYHGKNVAGDQSWNNVRLVDVEVYEAIYDFSSKHDEELDLKKGDVIRLISPSEEGWWKGSCCQRTGLFPYNYVKPHMCRHESLMD